MTAKGEHLARLLVVHEPQQMEILHRFGFSIPLKPSPRRYWHVSQHILSTLRLVYGAQSPTTTRFLIRSTRSILNILSLTCCHRLFEHVSDDTIRATRSIRSMFRMMIPESFRKSEITFYNDYRDPIFSQWNE